MKFPTLKINYPENQNLWLYYFSFFFIFVLIILVVTVTNKANEMINQPVTITPTESLHPEKISSPTFDRSKVMVTVLNGSRIAGKATKIAKNVKLLGYDNVLTGNILGDHQAFEVYISSDLLLHKDAILIDLQKINDEVTYKGDSPETTGSVKIVIGR